MPSIQPEFLKKGDKIILLSTARKITRGELELAIKIFTDWGLEVVLGKNIFKEYHQMAGSEKERAEDFQLAIDRKDIKSIVCVRGGYGTVKMIEAINFKPLVKNPKWLVGYSDVTVLHLLFSQKINLASIQSTMPVSFGSNSKAALESLRNALFGKPFHYKINAHNLNRNGKAKGTLVGGNLSIIYSLQGTKLEIEPDGKILFIEDVDEYLYHVDRMMMNLKLSGKLKKLKGLVVGSFSQMKDNTIPFGKSAEEIIYDAVKEYKYPVCFDFPAGHLNDNRALLLNTEARLDVNKYTYLAFGNLN